MPPARAIGYSPERIEFIAKIIASIPDPHISFMEKAVSVSSIRHFSIIWWGRFCPIFDPTQLPEMKAWISAQEKFLLFSSIDLSILSMTCDASDTALRSLRVPELDPIIERFAPIMRTSFSMTHYVINSILCGQNFYGILNRDFDIIAIFHLHNQF